MRSLATYLLLALLLCSARRTVFAQDTIFLPTDTIRVGELEWEMFKGWEGTRPIVTEFDELYGDKIQILLEFYPTGEVEQIIFGFVQDEEFIPHGPSRYYYQPGELLGRRTYVMGKLEGQAEDYYPLGQVKMKAVFAGDSLHGTYMHFYLGGQLEEQVEYANGLEQGLYQSWYSNGTRKEACNYEDGHRMGEDTAFYESGDIYSLSNYESDTLHGDLRFFHRNGRIWSLRRYEHGRLIHVSFIKDEKGDELSAGPFREGDGELNVYNEAGKLIGMDTYKDGLLIKSKDL